jgi:hypothetical protein
MTDEINDSSNDLNAGEIRLDRLLGRQVLAANNQPAGRLEEFRAEQRGSRYVITGYVIGVTGLIERLGLHLRSLVGIGGGGYVAKWDQLDISDPESPRLKCPLGELERH